MRPALTYRRIALAGGSSSEVAPWAFHRQFQAAVEPRDRGIVYSLVESGMLRQSRVLDLQSGADTAFPFVLYEHRFSRDGRWIAGESRDHEVLVCQVDSARCRAVTPKHERALTALAWSADGTKLFFLRHTSARVWGELTSVDVEGGAMKVHGPLGPFERDFYMFMDASPRDEIVFAVCRESPHELWSARLR